MKFPAILEQRTGFRGAKLSTFTLNNNYPSSVWPAILTSSGPPLSITGIELPLKASSFLDVSATWSGHIWARNQCANVNGKFQCQTGDCASSQIPCNDVGGIPPVTLAEFTLAANNGSGGCTAVSCSTNMNVVFPPELQVKGSDGGVVACNSACFAFNQPQYCCTGSYGLQLCL
ncbi:hypothetical protein V6N13_148899 [Hibiscus sabdariffa]